jgi:hypothetical protein
MNMNEAYWAAHVLARRITVRAWERRGGTTKAFCFNSGSPHHMYPSNSRYLFLPPSQCCLIYAYTIIFLISMGLEWNQVHYYCSQFIGLLSSPGWQKVMTVEQLVEWMSYRGNQSTRTIPAPMPLCPPYIPRNLNRARTQAVAVGSRRLTA